MIEQSRRKGPKAAERQAFALLLSELLAKWALLAPKALASNDKVRNTHFAEELKEALAKRNAYREKARTPETIRNWSTGHSRPTQDEMLAAFDVLETAAAAEYTREAFARAWRQSMGLEPAEFVTSNSTQTGWTRLPGHSHNPEWANLYVHAPEPGTLPNSAKVAVTVTLGVASFRVAPTQTQPALHLNVHVTKVAIIAQSDGTQPVPDSILGRHREHQNVIYDSAWRIKRGYNLDGTIDHVPVDNVILCEVEPTRPECASVTFSMVTMEYDLVPESATDGIAPGTLANALAKIVVEKELADPDTGKIVLSTGGLRRNGR